MSKLIIFIFSYLTLALAAPVEPDFVTWENEPDRRGTWSILSTCVLTLVLCVYTAVHMNIPAASQTKRQRWRHKAGWVCAGIFAPELVLWTAWQQWSEARWLTQQVKQIGAIFKEDPETHSDQQLRGPWTIKHSFFVIMGGYQFRPEVLAKWFADEDHLVGWEGFLEVDKRQPKSVLTSIGLIELLKHGKGHKLPVLTVQDIEDRSKADKLAKLLSCVQGFWLLTQIISRLASNLTITELEVNTLAHVICTIAMYAFWMKKPLGIEQPVWLEDDYLREWAFVVRSMPVAHERVSLCHQKRGQGPSEMADHELRIVTHEFHPSLSPENCETCRKNGLTSDLKDSLTLVLGEKTTINLEDIIHPLNSRPNGKFSFDFVSSHEKFHTGDHHNQYPYARIDHGQSEAFLELLGLPECDAWLDAWASQPLVFSAMLRRCSRMTGTRYMGAFIGCILATASSLYGGLHATLWRHHFPTPTELWMWRLSSLIVAGNGLYLALYFMRIELLCAYREHLKQGKRQILGVHQTMLLLDVVGTLAQYNPVKYLAATIFFAVQLIFVFCRVFLFVEAFISLRSQPQDAYDTVNWSQWLPHL